MLRQIRINYNIANAKGVVELTEEEKGAKEENEEKEEKEKKKKAKKAERKEDEKKCLKR